MNPIGGEGALVKVYVVRHGEAMNSDSDSERPLSEYGRDEIQRIADFMKSRAVSVDAIWHSTKVRARQTAEILQETIGGTLEERRGLSPNDTADLVAAELDQSPEMELCIVSHLPFVSHLASELVAGSTAAAWNFSTGAVLCLEREATGRWWAKWFISPEMLPVT